MRKALMLAAALPLASATFPAIAAEDINSLAREVKEMKATYEQNVAKLEKRIRQLEAEQKSAEQQVATTPPVSPGVPSNANAFNPAIGVILNGTLGSYSQKDNSVAGFQVGEEGERGDKGFSLGESEINLSANIDDLFTGSLTTALVNEDGEDKIEIEEAFVQSLGLPYGMSVKAGRMLASLGYMNEKHAHTDDFADRSLPYRVFLNNAFNDDGVQLSMVLPTDFYSEIGGGAWRGNDYPSADADSNQPNSYSAYARIGGDVGDNQNWRLGASWLYAKADGDGRITGGPGEELAFKGHDGIYILDAKYNWAPTGNAMQQEVSLQGEYFLRSEKGVYTADALATGNLPYNDNQSGWYGQVVYKFLPQWRTGYRYSALDGGDAASSLSGILPDSSHDPYIHSVMADWTHSEFSRVRLQYNNDHAGTQTDNQFLVQYVMSLGAHGAHKY